MKHHTIAAALALAAALAADLHGAAGESAPGKFEPSWESLKQYECPAWFRDAKLGIWAVWGPEAVPMQGDWYARHMYEEGSEHYRYHVAHYGHPSQFGYKNIIPLWKAEKWDPDGLMALYTCKQDPQGRWVQDLERGVMGEIRGEPWQTDTCVGGWYYDVRLFEQHRYKSATLVLQMLADIVSKNGNLLLNFPPRPDGTLDDDERKILDDLARWMPVNGGAIFGTRPWQVFGEGPSRVSSGGFNEGKLRYGAQDIRFTTKGATLYALALGWPDDRRLVIRSLATPAGKVGMVSLLGCPDRLSWEQTDAGLTVALPEKKPCEHVFALKIAGANLKPAPVAGDRPEMR